MGSSSEYIISADLSRALKNHKMFRKMISVKRYSPLKKCDSLKESSKALESSVPLKALEVRINGD
jgi:hypothetical protein